MERGLLIAVEGCDKSGKDTQIDEIAKRFLLDGEDVITIDFPVYDTPSGQAIRAILDGIHPLTTTDNPHEVQALYAINRYEQQTRIETALMQGKVVICNRYLHSAVVYGTFNGISDNWFYQIQHSLVQPDLVVLLDIDYDEYLKRCKNYEELDAYESDDTIIQYAINKYRQLAEEHEWIMIDGKGSIEDISELIYRNLKMHMENMEV